MPLAQAHRVVTTDSQEKRDQMMISGTAQIALPETGQKMQRKFSGAKVST
jgi:hypothetical protein